MLLLFFAACAPLGVDDLAPPSSAPAEVRDACSLASHRCSHCHSLDRVVEQHFDTPDEWRALVHRMRLTPGSDIPPEEEPVITRCLAYRETP
jgi:hypothetical protein